MRHLQCVQVRFEPDRLWPDRVHRAYEIVVRREVHDELVDAAVDRRRGDGGGEACVGSAASCARVSSEHDRIGNEGGAPCVDVVVRAPSQHNARRAV
jgi:hypothetical protein